MLLVTRLFSGLRTRLVVAFVVVMLIPVLGIGVYGYSFTHQMLSEKTLETSLNQVQLQAQHIVRSLAQAQGDALHLSELPSLTAFRRGQGGLAAVEQDFLVLLSVRPVYQNLRYIDETGRELVRVDSDGERAFVVAAEQLADRSQASYFQNIIPLRTASSYVSPFAYEGLVDGGPAVVHFALRLPPGDGLVLVDMYASAVLQNLPADSATEAWGMVDQDGKFMMFPQNFEQVSVERDDGTRQIVPELDAMLSGRAGTFETGVSVYAYHTIFPSSMMPNQFWVLYRDMPSSVLYAEIDQFYGRSVIFVGLALVTAIMLALLIARNIAAPVLDLQRKLAEFGHSGTAPQAPTVLPSGEIGALTHTFYDMAQELERKRRDARLLIERLITAQEEERKLVAYDLHDGLIQQMVGARLYLTHCRQHCPTPDVNGFKRGCDALSEAIVEGRRIIEGLRPATLDDLGLSAALAELAQSTAAAAGWTLDLDLRPLSQEPDKVVSVTVYRIAQEALNNARKHAQAKHVCFRLSNGEGISLRVQDDGVGFDTERVIREERGFGITTMRERAELLNGFCVLDSRPQQGTTVSVWIPWQLSVAAVDGAKAHG
ncbi:MAG: sensor histidine kinase [Anaerolineae bacterium]|nr:sensor histidine kinase [Anaerolineae bacterium]